MDRGAWWATVHEVAKSWTWLSTCACTHTHTHTIVDWSCNVLVVYEYFYTKPYLFIISEYFIFPLTVLLLFCFCVLNLLESSTISTICLYAFVCVCFFVNLLPLKCPCSLLIPIQPMWTCTCISLVIKSLHVFSFPLGSFWKARTLLFVYIMLTTEALVHKCEWCQWLCFLPHEEA